VLLIGEYSSGAHQRQTRFRSGTWDDGLLKALDVRAHGRQLQQDLDSQGPTERSAPHGEIETLRCRVQPSATPWQPEPRVRDNTGNLLARVIPLRDNSQQC
jgi:hypothetical protein